MTYPNFLVIGAQKAGTSWLDRNLRQHPQLWLPPEKEMHFFDFPPLMPFQVLRYLPNASIRSWANYRMNRDLRKVERGEQTKEWFDTYYYGLRNWRWYASLFTPSNGQLAGEITPRYAVINNSKIKKIKNRIPDCKIIYLLRNPIDRMWSDAAMFHGAKFGYAGIETVAANKIVRFLTRSRLLAHSRYSLNIKKWEAHFKNDQLLVCFYDQIGEQPKDLLRTVYDFLGVSTHQGYSDEWLLSKVNAQQYPAIPQNIGVVLAELLIDEVRALHQHFDNPYTARWLSTTEQFMQGRSI